jgi:hypothetical protein
MKLPGWRGRRGGRNYHLFSLVLRNTSACSFTWTIRNYLYSNYRLFKYSIYILIIGFRGSSFVSPMIEGKTGRLFRSSEHMRTQYTEIKMSTGIQETETTKACGPVRRKPGRSIQEGLIFHGN